jgi:hypothetical protein
MRRSRSQTLITGVYRTGTEFIAQIAGCHPALSVTMYSVNALRFVYGRFDPIEEPARYRAAVQSVADRVQERYQRTVPVAEILDRLAAGPRVTYGHLYDEVMCSLYLRPPAEHWVEKNQLLWREIPTFLTTMPNGRAVLVLRDPRSVLVSFKKYTYAPPPAYLGAVFNCFDAMSYAARYATEIPMDRLLVLRYEDAALRPQAAAEKLWSFLGLEGTYDVEGGSGRLDAYGKPWRANSSFHSNDDARPFDVAASINRWRDEIAPGELALAEGICGSLMPTYGYEVSGTPVNWEAADRLIGEDPVIRECLRRWRTKGTGIEAFPTDPLDKQNWRED